MVIDMEITFAEFYVLSIPIFFLLLIYIISYDGHTSNDVDCKVNELRKEDDKDEN